jgi:hypothetical protein
MPTFEAIVSVVASDTFIREAYAARNTVFAGKVRINRIPGESQLIAIASEDYLCVMDLLVVDLNMSTAEADTFITER